MFPGILWKSWVFGSLVNNFKADLQAATKETHMIWLWPFKQVYHKTAQQTALRLERTRSLNRLLNCKGDNGLRRRSKDMPIIGRDFPNCNRSEVRYLLVFPTHGKGTQQLTTSMMHAWIRTTFLRKYLPIERGKWKKTFRVISKNPQCLKRRR